MKTIAKILIFPALLFSLIACSSTDDLPSIDTARGLYESGLKLMKDERYEESISRFAEVKNKHPYSKYANEAELKIADVYYLRETYIEAENAYKLFKEFHPADPQIDYVTFRLAMSYFKQLPSSIDRDLSVSHKAILYFDEVIKKYPTSKHIGEAQKYKKEALSMLAQKELYIANFYFIRDHYDSALTRYEGLINSYSNLGFDTKAVYGAAISAYRSKNYKKAKHYLDYLAKYHKDSGEFKKANNEISNGK